MMCLCDVSVEKSHCAKPLRRVAITKCLFKPFLTCWVSDHFAMCL